VKGFTLTGVRGFGAVPRTCTFQSYAGVTFPTLLADLSPSITSRSRRAGLPALHFPHTLLQMRT